ncbi:MAG: ATP-binding protein [Verrucomicrobiota bacterium]
MTLPARFLCPLLWLLLSLSGSVLAQEEVPLTKISEVLALDGREAEEKPQPVKLKGTVLGVSTMFSFFTLSDGTGTIGVLKRREKELKQGDVVDVSGQTTSTPFGGRYYPRVISDSVEIVGTAELPQGRSVTLKTFNLPENYDQWVSLDAHVMEWKYRAPDLEITLVSPDGFVKAYVTAPEESLIPRRLHGARLRVTGAVVSTPAFGRVLFVPNVKQLETVEPGTQSIFEAPLVSIQDVMERKVETGKRLRVKGVLTARTQERKLILQGPDGAMICYLLMPRGLEEKDYIYGDAGQWPDLKEGDLLEVVGSVVNETDSDLRAFGLSWCHVRVVGTAPIPPPHEMELEELKALRNHDEWVSVEGVVTGWMQQNNILSYSIVGPHSQYVVHVRDMPSSSFPNGMHGAKLRFTGISRSLLQSTGDLLLVPSPAYVKVVRPGSADPFAVPESTVAAVAMKGVPLADRVRIRGTLIGRTSPEIVYVRGPGSAMSVLLQRPWSRTSGTGATLYADCGPWPELAIGDEVEIIGSPMSPMEGALGDGWDMKECHIRPLGRRVEVKPVEATIAEVAEGAHTSDLVEVRGRLLMLQQIPIDRGSWRTTMLLEADGVRIPASHHDRGRASFDTLKVDDEVLLRAMVDKATDRDPRQLWLISPGDARSLGVSPAVRTRQIWVWGGGAAAVLLIFSGWVAALRKSNRIKTEVAALLEQSVNERTAELSQTQADLTRALAQERELGELKSRFVTMVSHEFRTPLGIIMSAIELMRHYDERLPKEQREELQEDIFSSTRHMAGLMEQVLVLGRVEAGKLARKPASSDLSLLAEKLTDEALSATNRRCTVVWRPEGNLEGARADESLLRHIFSNIIANAVKYSSEGSEVIFTCRREGKDAVFQVIDHGIGIPRNETPRLFEAFHRCSNVGEIPGTGLGLVIVKRCVDLHEGTMEIDSDVGQGTTFTVRLPLFDIA